jgi:pyrophosphatase PpaX
MKYQAVLFDFDGTLANDLNFYIKAYDYALAHYGIHLSNKEVAAICFNKPEEKITAQLHLPSAEEFRQYYFEGIKKLFNGVPLFPGVLEILETLQKRKIKLGLVSFAHEWYIEMMLEQTGIGQYFQSIVTFNDVTKAKPDPEAIHLTSKKLDLPIGTFLSIGDARGDIIMGNAAGCDTALFLPNDNKDYYNFSELRKLNPTYEFASYQKLAEIVNLI